MNETNKLAEIERKLDMILGALNELLAYSPRANAEWYEQIQQGERADL